MAKTVKLSALAQGTRLLVGGDRAIDVPDEIVKRFRAGDALIVDEVSEGLLLIPQLERKRSADAVSEAKAAFTAMCSVGDEAISLFFERFAAALEDDAIWRLVTEANGADLADAERRGRSTTRLLASPEMRSDMIQGLRAWISAPSRRGAVIERIEHDGWYTELVGAALGVVAFVFEGRPNVLADATGVLRGGNTVVFRIGSDALRTAKTMMQHALTPALIEAGLPAGAVRLIDSAEHSAGWALFCDRRLSLAVARGSGPTVATLGALARTAGVPVSLHGTGGAWLVSSENAHADEVERAVFDSLDRKVCNTLNTLCIPRTRASELVPAALRGLQRAGERLSESYKLHVAAGDEHCVDGTLFDRDVQVRRAHGPVIERQAERLPETELGREWEWERTPEITLKLIDDLHHAVELFNQHSPQFIASLISDDDAEHERFYSAVNAPFVGEGRTRWVDGQKALGRPELGLSNWQSGRLLGRGGILAGDGVFTVRTRARRGSLLDRPR
jgi:glutamate-5-semialdehyde dehydrogenase